MASDSELSDADSCAVSSSEASGSDTSNNNVQNSGRKRKRAPEKWARNKLQAGRVAGRPHVNKGKHVPARALGSLCGISCRKKCSVTCSQEICKKVLQQFNEILSKNLQDSYLCGLIECVPVKRRRPRQQGVLPAERKSSYHYKVGTTTYLGSSWVWHIVHFHCVVLFFNVKLMWFIVCL
jgi:hypothetical protein